MTAFLNGLPRRVKRDALRALRGQILRSELYGLDGKTRQTRPYTVTEYLRGLREESPPTPDEPGRLHIFFPIDIAQRTTQWERGNDPMTQFVLSGDFDAYGQLLAQFNAAVPRGRNYTAFAPTGDPYLATLTETSFAQRDDSQWYCVNRAARSTSYEILNDGSLTIFQLAGDALAGIVPTRVFGQTYTYYDGGAFQGLPLGQLGDYGAVSRTETLVFTEDILNQGYSGGDTILSQPEQPPYLTTSGSPAWTSDYPPEFQSLLPATAGYVFHTGGGEDVAGFFAATGRQYDFQQGGGLDRGLVMAQRDPLGHDTSIAYDTPYQILPVLVTNPTGLRTKADYDYRVMKPRQVTDPNGNSTSFTFTSLGLLASTSVTGKSGEGDQKTPSIQRQYDFLAFANLKQPIFVRTIRREYHDTQTEVTVPQRDETLETREYSDGLGRIVQTRTQAENEIFGEAVFGSGVLSADQTATTSDAIGRRAGSTPWVVVSGWQIYNNKGRVAEKYEPFFDVGWDYAPPTSAQSGQKVSMHYDPRGLMTLTVNPDGSKQIVVYGVPGTIAAPDLTNPNIFEPTPWETYTYDANDNAGRTHPATSSSYQSHWNTPSSIKVDALGRPIVSTQRNGPNPATEWYLTTSTYDIQGNLLTVMDALGRLAFQLVYDLVKHPLRIHSIDAGIRRTVLDAAGNAVEQRDTKGAILLRSYDLINRPIRLWARDGKGQALTLRERRIYGDGSDSGLSTSQAVALNLLGKIYRRYDEAGLVVLESYDFKGNVLEKTRQVISDAAILAVFIPPPANWQVEAYRVDWQPPTGMTLDAYAGTLLDAALYTTSQTYDALNRTETFLYPEDVSGARSLLTPQYNRAGGLQHLELNGMIYVDRIVYNPKGQRSLVAYGNRVMTRYAYDPRTFRLARLCTEPYTTLAALAYHPVGASFQDFAYGYDLAGNILLLNDRTRGSGIPNTVLGTDALDRAFAYDPVYRLITASGRECATRPTPPFWNDAPLCTDATLTHPYNESYKYDSVGNIVQIGHSTGAARSFKLVAGNNRLASVGVGQSDFAYFYDVNGNMVQENSERYFEWDECDRLRAFRTQASNAEPSVYTHYLYDATGLRVKKLVRKQGGQYEVTIYVDGVFEHQRIVQGQTILENNTLHVMDDKSRVALVRAGNPFPDDGTPAVKYQFGDHLGSSNVVIDESGHFVNREEYTPYGETSFGSFALKRYRFSSKERDHETGLNYHAARYYAPWLGRWLSCDRKALSDSPSAYVYCRDSPTRCSDPTGEQAKPPSAEETVKGHLMTEFDQRRIAYATEVNFNLLDANGNRVIGGRADFVWLDPKTNQIKFLEAKGELTASKTINQEFYIPELEKGATVEITGVKAGNLGLTAGVKVSVGEGGFQLINQQGVSEFTQQLIEAPAFKFTTVSPDGRFVARFFNTAQELLKFQALRNSGPVQAGTLPAQPPARPEPPVPPEPSPAPAATRVSKTGLSTLSEGGFVTMGLLKDLAEAGGALLAGFVIGRDFAKGNTAEGLLHTAEVMTGNLGAYIGLMETVTRARLGTEEFIASHPEYSAGIRAAQREARFGGGM